MGYRGKKSIDFKQSDYKTNIEKQTSSPPDFVNLLDELMGSYVKKSRPKLNEIVHNIIVQEQKASPELDKYFPRFFKNIIYVYLIFLLLVGLCLWWVTYIFSINHITTKLKNKNSDGHYFTFGPQDLFNTINQTFNFVVKNFHLRGRVCFNLFSSYYFCFVF